MSLSTEKIGLDALFLGFVGSAYLWERIETDLTGGPFGARYFFVPGGSRFSPKKIMGLKGTFFFMREPWLKIYPKILRSKIMDYHANTLKVFMVILCLAKWKDESGVKRGQLRSSLPLLSRVSRLSVNSVRGTLRNLVKLEIITLKGTLWGTYRGTLITVLNYGQYQTMGTYNGTLDGTRRGTDGGDTTGDKKDVKTLDVKVLREEWKNGRKSKSEVLAEIEGSTRSFKAQDILIEEIFGGGENADIGYKSITEQALERRRAQGLGGVRAEPTAGEVLNRIRGMSEVQATTGPDIEF